MTISAYILVETTPGASKNVLGHFLNMDHIEEAHAVTGPYDAIIKVRAADVVKLGDMVVAKIQTVTGVLRTTTCICLTEPGHKG